MNMGGNWYPYIAGYSGRQVFQTSAGELVNETVANTIPAWFACIRNISEDVGKLPRQVFRRLERGRKSEYKSPQARVIREPNEYCSAQSFFETLVAHALGFGDGYAEIALDGFGDVPMKFYNLDPTTVTPEWEGATLQYKVRMRDGTHIILPAHKVLHLHGFGGSSTTGYNPALIFRELLGAAVGAQKFGGAMWRNGAFLGGVLQHPASLSDEALKNLRDSFEARHGGGANAGKMMILEEGMTYTSLAVDPSKAQYSEQSNFYVEEISRIYRMPLHKISSMAGATFSNIEQQAMEYVQDCLMSWLVRLEQELDRKLFINPADDDLYVKHNVMALLRGDSSARSDYYTKMIQLGMTQNQILELEEMNPIGPEGDIPYIALNLRPSTPEARELSMQKVTSEPVGNQPVRTFPKDKGGRPPGSRETAQKYAEVFETLLDPLVRKECNAVGKLAKRMDGKSDFVLHVQRFHVEHRGHMLTAIEPALGSLVAIIGGNRDDARVSLMSRATVDGWLDKSAEQFAAVDYPRGVDRLLELQMTQRLGEMAQTLCNSALLIVEDSNATQS